MSNSNYWFLTCIQISQEAGKLVWYSHFLKNFPQFVVIHSVKGFGIASKAEVDVFLELSCFLMIQHILAIPSLVPLPFLNPAWTSGSSRFIYGWSLAWRILIITFLVCELGEGHGTPLQYSCLENPMEGGAWKAAVHGVAKSRARQSDFTFTFHFHAWRRKWQPTPVFLPGESQGRGSLVGCHLWGRTESDTTEAT